MSEILKFNIRVYLILYDQSGWQIVVSDELIRGNTYTKFPGGGVELGEGIADAAKREAMEELGIEVLLGRQLYVSDFFIRSAFIPTDQIISVYYEARSMPGAGDALCYHRSLRQQDQRESFRWVSLEDLANENFAFPADRYLVKLITQSAE